jgi:hypothetical protein
MKKDFEYNPNKVKMSQRTVIIMGLGAGIGVFLLYLFLKKRNEDKKAKEAIALAAAQTTTNPQNGTQTTPANNPQNAGYLLDYNKKLYKGIPNANLEVRALQTLINQNIGINPKLAVDGNFGAMTENGLYSMKSKTETTLNQYLGITPYDANWLGF